jgi:hypothetical protein
MSHILVYASECKLLLWSLCHVMNLSDANNTEFDPDSKTPCVIFMPGVIIVNKGFCLKRLNFIH